MNEMESLKEEIKKLDEIISDDKEYLKKHPDDIYTILSLEAMEGFKQGLILKNTPIEEKSLEEELKDTQKFNKELQKHINEGYMSKYWEKTLIASKKYEKLLIDQINQKNYKNELKIKNDMKVSK